MIFVESDKTKSLDINLLNPHYTRTVFNRAQTIFLAPGFALTQGFGTETVEGAHYNYSDRLFSWYMDKHETAMDAAQAKGFAPNSAAVLEAFLQELLEDPKLNLVHILTGVNLSNGYPYRVYGYIPGEGK